MPKRPAGPFLTIDLDPQARAPLYWQLYLALRAAILQGRLAPGTRLPSTRSLGADLTVSRNTVVEAVDQLRTEGYVECRIGAGTTVVRSLPDALKLASAPPPPAPAQPRPPRLSRRGRLIASLPVCVEQPRPRPFRPAVPALECFPIADWGRLESRAWRRGGSDSLGRGNAQGLKALRQAIAHHLDLARGVRCTADQVIIVNGSQHALYLSGQILLDPGQLAWLENPVYPGARAALLAAGARLVPVPVDAEGLNLAAAPRTRQRPRVVFITPSHQYPLGVTMTLGRRLELLRYAREHDTWILEDDYDGEFRFASRPIAALQGLDRSDRVIYMGTFSKVLVPAIRLGYLVVPDGLVDAFSRAVTATTLFAPTITQAVLADFIGEGYFERHVRRMRALYAARQAAIVDAASRELDGLLRLEAGDAGNSLVGWLPDGWSDRAASAAAESRGVLASPISEFCLRPIRRSGLVLSYGAFDEAAIRQGITGLARALEQLSRQDARLAR